MQNDIKSKLSFINYQVKEILLKQNENFNSDGQPIEVKFDVEHKTEILNNIMKINLIVTIFDDAEKNNYPFYIKVRLEGRFGVEGDNIEMFEINGIALLYPYVRSIISTYTANSNIPTLILPPINIHEYYRKYQKENEKK